MDELRKLFMAGIAAVKPQRLISECLSRNSKTLRVNSIQESHSCEMILPDKGVHLFGFGKAASEMMQATIEIIGNENIASGIALVPKQEEELFNYHNWENITTFFGAKGNLPDEDSLKGSQKALKMIEGLDSDDLLLVLISGGGSALFEIPVDGISLNEEVEIVNQLSRSGATIAEINTVRKRLSKVKGGGLARMCKGKIIALIISDVIGDHLDVIASGTTVCNKDSSNAAFDVLSKHNIDERASFLHKIKEELLLQQSYIANILSRENGKPLPEAMGEVGFAASFFEWFAEEGRRAYGEHIPAPSVGKQIVTVREPAGVVAVITPWNFPIGMIARKVAALLAAGCTCVVKPAEDTPLTAIAFAKIVEKCGIPNGVFNLIPTSRENAPSIGKLFAESADISVISFTGSTVVGKQLYLMAGSSVKRIALELGGNAPFIVFNQADLALAV
ncbi:uncharacterized protein LOC136040955 isoform X2 [Artemia franciscana]|uniref:uncharacterized protein LOC136040955 isoform X2 n=1 Tax=Artemia franciscana TaxID=6661 RepID=UPI0032DBB1D5